MLDRIPFYGQVLVFTGIALGIVAAAYFIYPDLSRMKTEIVDLESEIRRKKRLQMARSRQHERADRAGVPARPIGRSIDRHPERDVGLLAFRELRPWDLP